MSEFSRDVNVVDTLSVLSIPLGIIDANPLLDSILPWVFTVLASALSLVSMTDRIPLQFLKQLVTLRRNWRSLSAEPIGHGAPKCAIGCLSSHILPLAELQSASPDLSAHRFERTPSFIRAPAECHRPPAGSRRALSLHG